MRRLSIHAVVVSLALWNCAFAQEAPTECAAPVSQTALVPASKCAVEDVSCNTWSRFRAQHPFPYQTIAVSVSSDGALATIVVSEPPPLAERSRYVELFKATFQVPPEAIRSMRFQVGLDGWLEDWVIALPLGNGGSIAVPGPDAKVLTIPSDLAGKLDFVSAALYGTRVGFYVESIGPETSPQLPIAALPDLQVSASSLSRLAQDKSARWIDVSSTAGATRTFGEAITNSASSTLINPKDGIVMLVIPPGTQAASLRAEFRKFAVASDYLVGSIRPKRGGLLLFGRSRVESLAVLPPLRFETLQSLAKSLGQPLGQSYERQRIFAGKIASGTYAGWDWAPIYLSAQLQDSEFGTLLNIADQQLKSWSECSRVQYAAFDYPSPKEFPFGKVPASTWVMEKALSNSLIFNWNTSGFATVSDSAQGRVVSAMGTAALPVSYIVPDDPQTKVLRMMLEAIEGRDKAGKPLDVATAASNTGSQYFAKRGDPIIARVAQNVLLYQILGEAKPFAAGDAGEFVLPKAADRSDIVTKLLVAEATPWLSAMLASPEGIKVSVADGAAPTDLRSAMQRAGLTTGQLAELLATPQYQAQRMLALKSAVDLKIAGYPQFEERWNVTLAELKESAAQSNAAFKTHCVTIGGSVSTVMEKGDSYLRCDWKAPAGTIKPTYVNPYATRVAELKAELETIKRESAAVEADVEAKVASLKRFSEQSKLADAVGAQLRTRATDSKDLDGVLQKVLAATHDAESKGSIQTPSVVLSQNVAEKFSVGGHNIDGLPWDVQAAATKSGGGLRWIGDRPTAVVPREQAGNSAAVARSYVTKEPPKPQVEGPMLETLKLSEAPPASFVEMLAKTGNLPVPDADLMARAALCRCDIYVERAGSNVTFLVETKPPPKARAILGDAGVRDNLGDGARGKAVLFAGFPRERVMAIAEGVEARTRLDPRVAPLEESISTARRYFSKASESIREMFSLRTKEGNAVRVALDMPDGASHGLLVKALRERPSWAEAKVTGNRPSLESPHLVEVQYGPTQGMKVVLRNESGAPVGVDPAAAVASSRSVLASAARDKAEVEETVMRVADRLYRDNKNARSVDVFLAGVGQSAFIFDPHKGQLVLVAAGE